MEHQHCRCCRAKEIVGTEMSSQEIKVRTDIEVLVGALEEAQRLLATYESPCCNRSRDDILAMLEFIICDPSVRTALLRQRSAAALGDRSCARAQLPTKRNSRAC